MRIQRGIDERFLISLLVLGLLIGCVVQPGEPKPLKPKTDAASITELTRLATLENLHTSADALDAVADRVKSGEIKYDKPLQEAIVAAYSAGLDGPQNKKLSTSMSAILSPGETFDAAKTEAALRQHAAGRRQIK